MSIPLITWEAPEPLGGPPAGAAVEETAANRLLQLSLQEMIQLEKDALKQQKQQQQPQQQQPKQQQPKQQPKQQQQQQQQQQRKQQPRQQPPRQQQQQQQPHQQQRRVLLRPSPALVSPEKETGGKWRELLRAVCVEALGVPDAGWPSIRLVENAEAFLIPQAEAVSSDAAAAAADTCCVLFPSAAAAAAALQQRSSPCDLLLQRHKEQLVLQLQQLEMIFDSDPEEGELQQQQQQQVELLREQADSLRQLEEHKETDPDIRTCLLQLAKWRRTVSVPASSDGKSYQLLLRRTAAPDLPSAAAETAASPSKVVELRPTLNFTVAAAAAAGKASKGAPGETGGVEERALLQDTVALQASRGNFRSWVLRGGIDLGEGPLRPSSTRAKLTPRAEGDMETDALYRHWGEGAPGGPPKGSPPGTGRGAEEEPRWERVEDRRPQAATMSPLAVASHGQRGGGGPREGPPARERPRMRRSRSRSWDRHMRDRSRRGRGSSRWRRDSSSSVSWSSSHSSSSCSSREASRHRRRRRDSYEDSSKDSKNRKGRGFKAKRRGMAADRELARGEHRHRRRRDSD